MAGLPRLMTLMRSSRFFQYETEEGELHATVRNTSDTIISENNFTLLEVESSRAVQGMVHIKSCYNNKYLRLNPTGVFISATADELEEDRATRSCTLFRSVISGNKVHFFHLSDNVERNVVVYQGGVLGVLGSTTLKYNLTFRDMTNLVLLPKHVLFKGSDGKYLRARKNKNLEFVANDPTDPRVHHIATVAPRTGNFSLLSTRFNLYWERWPFGDWVNCNSTTPHSANTTFRPVRQSFGTQANTIALLNTTNNNYCDRLSSGRIRASSSTIPPTAVMTVEEAVRDREISDIRYRIEDARIYDMVPLQSVTQTVYNYGNHDERQKVGFTYREVIREKFTSSHSWKLSVKATIKVRLIPIILQGKLTTTASYGGSVEWSKEKTIEKTASGSTTATVPARSSTRVTLIVGQGSMDVPYSYRQSDILMDGTFEEKTLHDGLFLGLNTFEFQYIIDPPQPLPSSARSPTGHDDIVIVPGESKDLPKTAISSIFNEVNVEGKEEEPLPMEQDLGEGKEEPLPLPRPSKL